MFTHYRLIGSCLLILFLCSALIAQNDQSNATQRTTPIVTIAATASQVRITAPSSITQVQLAVYSEAGEKVFEATQSGNVLDYAVQDRAGVRLIPGNYLCVVKVKSLSGRLSEKLGQLSVQENQVTVQPAETGQLTVAQTQILSTDSEATPLTAPAENEAEASTVIAHDGTDGQMIRGRGALSFRLGDFFRARDKEQMRLSEDGNLDVAGTIRAQRFLVIKPDSIDKKAGTVATTDSVESVQPLVWGTGTTGKLTKWMDGTGGLADSIITESGNTVGIGTTNPNSLLELKAATPILTFNANTNDSYRGLNWMGAGYANVLGSVLMNGHSGDLQIKSGFAGYGGFVSLHTNGLERMRAAANGNIGIGTTSPYSLLELNATTPILSFNANNRDSFHGVNWLANGYGPNPLGSILMNAQSGELQMRSGYPGWGGFFTFHTNGVERMRINPNGNIGIGTENANNFLTVNGRASFGGVAANTGTEPVEVQGSGAGVSYYDRALGAPHRWVTYADGGLFRIWKAGDLVAIDGSGKVGIGTTTPGSKLTVNGVIESKSGGFKFPDGTTQTTAGGGGSTGTITGVTAGTGLTGGGSSGSVTLGLGNTAVAAGTYTNANITVDHQGRITSAANGSGSGTGGPAILNQTTLQGAANFNIDGNGKANTFEATVGFKFPDGTIQTTAGGSSGSILGVKFVAPPADNTFLGLNLIPGGNWNTFVSGSNPRTITGSYNTVVGAYVTSTSTSGTDNSIFGANAGNFAQAGNRNAFFGSASAGFNTTGSDNAFFGTTTGWSNVTGNNNTLLGNISDVGAANLTNATAIGYRARVAQSNSLVLGSINGINGATADTNVGIGTTTPADRLDVNGDIRVGDTDTNGCLKNNNGGTIVGTCSSDVRFKRNLQPFGKVLNRVTRLQPYYFFWRAAEFPEKRFGSEREAGLVAQQVEQVMPELVTTDKDGYKMVDYSKLPLITLQALTELKAQNDALQQQNAATQKENAALKARLDRLERSVRGMRRPRR